MNQSDQYLLSEEDNTSFRDSDLNSDEDSVDIISTDCVEEDFNKISCSGVNADKNKFSIANILGLDRVDVTHCDSSKTDNSKEESDDNIIRTEYNEKVKCIKPTPISARSTG